MPKVQIKNLHKYFEKNEVLKGIDLEVNEGEVVCVIGPSGSGKSTMLRCINLLEVPTDGEITVDGLLAQLGERLPCKQEVTSSNLVFST